jgi:hypothetical protein
MWRREVWVQLQPVQPGATFAAIDEAAWQRIHDVPAISQTVCSIKALDVIPRIPLADLEWILQGTCQLVQAKDIEEQFLVVIDLFDRPTPEQRRRTRQALRAELDIARQQVRFFTIDTLVNVAVKHSRQRLIDLLEGRIPEPSYPPVAEKP